MNSVHEGIKSFQCSYCEESFIKKIDRKRHQDSVHEGSKIFCHKCEFCEKTFSSPSNLKQHVTTVHEGIKTNECSYCKKCFSKKNCLKRHIQTVHEGVKNYHCDKCDYKAGTMDTLKSHIASFHERFCKECEKVFSKKEYLEHMESVHGSQKYSCEVCSKMFSSTWKLDKHLKNDHLQKPCSICNKEFENLKQLRSHKKTVHEIETKPKEVPYSSEIICEDCGQVFNYKYNLQNHRIRMHQPSQNIPCDQCDMVFKVQKDLTVHIRNIHQKTPCTICGQMFGERMMKRHMLRNHPTALDEVMPFTCKICSKGFMQKASLLDHMNTHTGEKPHKCKYCGKSFGDKRNMLMHQKTVHEGFKRSMKSEKSYQAQFI